MDLHTKRTAYASVICRYCSEFQRPIQCDVFTVIRNRATHGFLLNFITSYYLLVTKIRHVSVIAQTCLVYDYKSQSAGLTVTVFPIQRKPNQMYYSSIDITYHFWKQTFRPPKSNTRFQRDRITHCKSGLCFEVSSNYQIELCQLQP